MVTMKSDSLHRRAQSLLAQAAFSPKRLVLLHTAIALGASLVMTLCNYLVGLGIADTGGLGGIGMRSMLSTLQTMLELAVMTLLPFWEMGLVFCALRWAKDESPVFRDLTEGFRRFGAIFLFRLLYGAVFVVIGITLMQLSSVLFMLTPFSLKLAELYEPLLNPSLTQAQMEALLTPEFMANMAKASLPMLILFGVIFLAVGIPLFYRLRFAKFALMDGARPLPSLLQSFFITRKQIGGIVKLDLHFWWYYLLQMLCLALCLGDSILAMLGIYLPVSSQTAFFLFYAAGLLGQGVLLWQTQAQVLTTYALAYDALLPPAPATDIIDAE